MDRAISLNEEDIDKAMNKDEAGEELLEVIGKMNFHINPPLQDLLPPPSLNKMNKLSRINKLIKLQRMYFGKDKQANSKLEAASINEFGKKYPSSSVNGRLEDLYTNKIYCLSEEVINKDRYKSVD